MRVMHVCPFLDEQWGGSERFVSNLSKAQSAKIDVQVLTTTKSRDSTGVQAENGVTIRRVYSPWTIWNVNPLSMALFELNSADYDIIHIHSYLYTLSAQAILSKIMKKRKSVLQIHGGIGPIPTQTLLSKRLVKYFYDRTLGRFIIKQADVLASVSRVDLKSIKDSYHIPDNRLRYIPNIVDTTKFNQLSCPNGSNIILYVGDLEPWKGVRHLLHWIRNGIYDSEDITFRLVGQGSLLDKAKKIQSHLELRGGPIQLEILGQISHSRIPDIMKEAKALVLPSLWEGMPTVILEAMATGIPVITTPIGEIRNVITQGETGYFIKPTLQSFTDTVNLVMNDGHGIKRVITQAKNLIDSDYSIESVTRKTIDLYKELLVNE
ncbi:MAG: glycosyltransferase family 4 protein [Candidatus Thorarchaeota archaeon]|jgi:glycosyltransferase involved in cell wall biosynthesis